MFHEDIYNQILELPDAPLLVQKVTQSTALQSVNL